MMPLRFCQPRGGANRWPLFAAFTLLAITASAQSSSPVLQAKKTATQRVTTAPVGPVTVAAGASKKVEIPFRVAPGYHINSHKPTSELLVATALKVNPPTNIEIGKLTYPAGEDRSFPFAPDEKLNVYTGDFAVTALVRPARNTPTGTFRVKAVLEYQACDDRACFPPGTLPVAFDVKVTKAVGGQHRRNPAQSPHVHQ